MAPASDAAPKAAVFLTYAAADEHAIFGIAEKISRCGVGVFLSQACIRPDRELHIHNALSFADEVLVLITPTRADDLKTDSDLACMSGHLVWLAIGVARALGIPIRGLLKGISREDVVEESAIPRFIRDGRLFDTVESYLTHLSQRIPKAPPKLNPRLGLRCNICLCRGGQCVGAVSKFVEELAHIGLHLNMWTPSSDAAEFDAVVVVDDGQPSQAWQPEIVSFLEDFVGFRRPLALLAPPNAQKPSELPERLQSASFVECSESGSLPLLQLVWKIVGYKQYDIGTDLAMVEKPPAALAQIAAISNPGGAVFICYAHADNQNQDPKQRWLDRLLEFLHPLVRQKALTVWSDLEIKIGDQWHERIRFQLEVSKAIVLLVSPAFLASEYIATKELPVLLKNAADRGATVLPVIISPCLYEEAVFKYPDPTLGPNLLKLSSLQSANPPSRTLIDMNEAEQNRILLQLARNLQEIAPGLEVDRNSIGQGPALPIPGEPLRVFISYSHKDERLRRELETHLTLLQRQKVIAMWTDRRIMPGEEWKDRIDENLDSAGIILLLVSADFVASRYCYDVEMTRALERHDAGEARVVPIILRSVDWHSAPFGKLQALPTDGKPVTLWTDRPSAWTDVAAGIRKVAEQIRSHK